MERQEFDLNEYSLEVVRDTVVIKRDTVVVVFIDK